MKITRMHGAGGKVMQDLIKNTILNNLENTSVNGGIGLKDLDDGATIPLGDKEIVFTVDGHTVNPIFFPGGDIGKLAVCGTVNDLVVCGAQPLFLSSSMIIEEGFPKGKLERIIHSAAKAAREAGVKIVTGDTKVVEKGAWSLRPPMRQGNSESTLPCPCFRQGGSAPMEYFCQLG